MSKSVTTVISVLSVLIIIMLAIAGCPGPTTPQTTSPSPTPTDSPEPDQTIELKLAITVPAESANGKNYSVWADEVEKRTGGKVKVNCYFAGSLLKGPEMFRGVRSGIADIGVYQPGIEGGLLALNTFTELHFLGLGDHLKATAIAQELYATFPELYQEYTDAGLKLYKPNLFPGYQIHTTTEMEIKTPDDLEGLKIISTGGPFALAIQAGGGAPLDIPVNEYYTSLEKGLADGIVTHSGILDAFKITELLPCHTMFGDAGVTTRSTVMMFNLNSWNNLPADIQEVMNELEPEAIGWLEQGMTAELGAFYDKAENAGHSFYTLTPEEIKVWSDLYVQEHAEWVEEMEAAGKPGQAIYDELKRLIAEYSG